MKSKFLFYEKKHRNNLSSANFGISILRDRNFQILEAYLRNNRNNLIIISLSYVSFCGAIQYSVILKLLEAYLRNNHNTFISITKTWLFKYTENC